MKTIATVRTSGEHVLCKAFARDRLRRGLRFGYPVSAQLHGEAAKSILIYADGIVESVRAAGSMERFARERAAKLGMPPGRRSEETIAQMACKSATSYIASTYATWNGDYRDILASIRVPALVICGANDTVAPPHMSREIARAIPGARLEIVEGAGHVVNADAPDRFNALLRGFLEGQT